MWGTTNIMKPKSLILKIKGLNFRENEKHITTSHRNKSQNFHSAENMTIKFERKHKLITVNPLHAYQWSQPSDVNLWLNTEKYSHLPLFRGNFEQGIS